MCDALSGVDYRARLERAVGAYMRREAVAVCSFDAAVHTALYLCGVRAGDYVFVPSYTFFSNLASVSAMGAVPVFVDSDPTTRCMSASALETALLWSSLQNKPPKAVVIDNAFGAVADYDVLVPLAKSFGAQTVELTSDALGGEYKGKPCGGNCDYGAVGFKRISGGGAILTCGDDRADAERFCRMRFSSGENHDYKMDNVVAALDAALFDGLKKIVSRARGLYGAVCAASETVAAPCSGDAAAYALCRPKGAIRLSTVKRVVPTHTLPMYKGSHFFEHEPGFSVCDELCRGVLVGLDVPFFARRGVVRRIRAASRD